MTKAEAMKAFQLADDAWGAALKVCRIYRYSPEAKGKPNSMLRGIWERRLAAMREWETACGLSREGVQQ